MTEDFEDKRICPNCGKEVLREDMLWTYDCHHIPFELVCYECERVMTEGKGYAGEYYNEADEQIEDDY